MSILKRMTAFLTAFGVAAGLTACGSNTRQALVVNGYEVPAGVYIYFANSAYNEALSKLSEETPDLDTADLDAVKAATLEGKDVRTWVQDKATESCVDFVLTEQKFDELGLEMGADEDSYTDMMMEYYWSGNKKAMERNGISEDSFRKILVSSTKSDLIFEYYYGIDGEEGVTEDELYTYYKENNIRCQYVAIDLKDGEGNLLKSDGKAEMMKMVEGYRDRVEDAYDEGGVGAVMTEMNYVKEDYSYYVTSISEEAAGVEEPTTTTPRTTAAAETTAAEETETSDGETEAETTVPDETAEEETAETETTAASEEDSTDEEGDTEDTLETTETETTTVAEESTEAGTVGSDEESNTETTSASDEETGETETTDTQTETETVTYDNESIISLIDPDDYDSEDDITYTPSKKVYNKLLEIEEADYGKPFIVEEDEQYYLVVRYDIEDRMTDTDLWTETASLNADYDKYGDAFEEMTDEWASTADTKRNDAAYRRYDPYKFDFSTEQ